MSEQLPHDEELRALYRRLPADEPRAELDDAILAAARRRNDIERRRTMVRRLRWTVPMAAAAGVVMTLTLTKLTPEQNAPVLLSSRAPQAPPPQAPAESYASSDEMREEAAPLAQHDDRQALNLQALNLQALDPQALDHLRDGAAAAPDSRAGGDNAFVVDRPAARADAAPMVAKKAEGPKRAAVDAPSAPAQAAPAEAAPAGAANSKSRALAQMVESAAAPEAREPDAAGRASGDALKAKIAGGGLACDETTDCPAPPPGWEPPPAPVEILPFGLEAGLEAEEACRRVSDALHVPCQFHAGLVELVFNPPVVIDRGRLGGKIASRMSLGLRDGTLQSALVVVTSPDGIASPETLLTPPPEALR